MTEPAPAALPYTVEQYFALVDQGVLDPDDRVELLEGIIVSMSPQSPRHASAIRRVQDTLRRALGERALVHGQLPLLIGKYSAPEPDVMVLAGTLDDYDQRHPTTALLVVEVADSSLKQDRLTKAAIYAAGGISEYWLVNLRDDCVEVSRVLDPQARRYRQTLIVRRGETISIAAFPDTAIAIGDLLPRR